jgi:NhaA family Na+:H+ antiporter
MSANTQDGGRRSPAELIREFSIPLIAGVLMALLWANLDQKGYETVIHYSPFGGDSHLNLHFFANEVLMVFFFGVAAKEITEAVLPGGALNPPRKAVNPLMATIGGVVGPVGAYFACVVLLDAPEIKNGWGIPTATDIALAWLVARLVFGARHPAVSFLLLLAVADDAIGLGIIAVFYPDPNNPVAPMWLLLVAAAMVSTYALKRMRVMNFWPYVILGGGLSWYGLHAAHLHPALALVPIVPFMPNRGRDEGLFQEHGRGFHDTLNAFEHFFKSPVDYGLFTFGLANAGVMLSSVGPATWAVLAALIVGKTVGITGFSMGAVALGFPLPKGMNVRSLVLAGLTAALGLTVALFVAGVAFQEVGLQSAAKMGALLSSVAAPIVLVLGKLLGVKRKETVAVGEPEPIINPSGRISLRGRSDTPSEREMDLDASAGEPDAAVASEP